MRRERKKKGREKSSSSSSPRESESLIKIFLFSSKDFSSLKMDGKEEGNKDWRGFFSSSSSFLPFVRSGIGLSDFLLPTHPSLPPQGGGNFLVFFFFFSLLLILCIPFPSLGKRNFSPLPPLRVCESFFEKNRRGEGEKKKREKEGKNMATGEAERERVRGGGGKLAFLWRSAQGLREKGGTDGPEARWHSLYYYFAAEKNPD